MRGGPRSFRQGFTCPGVLWIPPRARRLPGTGLSPSPAGFPKAVPLLRRARSRGPNPAAHAPRFGLLRFRSPLLPESMFLSFPPATQMFHFAGFPSARYGFARGCTGLPRAGFPIQTPADLQTCAPPRSFSQLVASFLGCQCQGIRPVPFLLGPSRPRAQQRLRAGPRFRRPCGQLPLFFISFSFHFFFCLFFRFRSPCIPPGSRKRLCLFIRSVSFMDVLTMSFMISSLSV